MIIYNNGKCLAKKKKGRYLQFYNSFCSFYIVRFNDMLLSLPMYIIWHKWIIHARHANDRRPKNKTIPNCRTEKVQMNNTIIYANALYISHHTLLHHILFFFFTHHIDICLAGRMLRVAVGACTLSPERISRRQ